MNPAEIVDPRPEKASDIFHVLTYLSIVRDDSDWLSKVVVKRMDFWMCAEKGNLCSRLITTSCHVLESNRVTAVIEKRFTVVQRNFAAWIAAFFIRENLKLFVGFRH